MLLNNINNMKDFIYEKDNSLSKELCEKLINYFESNIEIQYEGIIGVGEKISVNKKKKETIDISIKLDELIYGSELYTMVDSLVENLKENLQCYIEKLKEQNVKFSIDKLSIKLLLLQRYKSNEGKFTYHTDFKLEKEMKYRLINFIWYLNDVEEGGETEFFGNYKIKPTQGKIVFFPSEWFYPHQGKMPLSNNKYILTGWIHTDVI